MKTRIAINGFGRIGRNLFRLLLNHPDIEVIAINDIADTKTMAHLVKYDSIHGVLPNVITKDETGFSVDGKQVLFDVNLSIGEGEVFGFLGPNGAGKTTTMKTIL